MSHREVAHPSAKSTKTPIRTPRRSRGSLTTPPVITHKTARANPKTSIIATVFMAAVYGGRGSPAQWRSPSWTGWSSESQTPPLGRYRCNLAGGDQRAVTRTRRQNTEGGSE